MCVRIWWAIYGIALLKLMLLKNFCHKFLKVWCVHDAPFVPLPRFMYLYTANIYCIDDCRYPLYSLVFCIDIPSLPIRFWSERRKFSTYVGVKKFAIQEKIWYSQVAVETLMIKGKYLFCRIIMFERFS